MNQSKIVPICLFALAMSACKPKKNDVTPKPTPITLSNYGLYHIQALHLTLQDTLTQCEIYFNQPYAGNASIMAFDAVGSEIAFPYLRFVFRKFSGVGSYPITDTGNCNAYYYYSLGSSVAGVAGMLTLTDSLPYRGTFTVTYSD